MTCCVDFNKVTDKRRSSVSSVKRGRYVGTRRFRVRGQRTPEVNKVALTALKYFNALITAKLIASINALTLTALFKTVCSCCEAPHLSHPWCSRVPGDTSSCTARCQAAGTARTGSPSPGPCCSSTRTWSHCSCWWTTAGTWSAAPHCSRSPSCCLKGKEKTSKTSECLELELWPPHF